MTEQNDYRRKIKSREELLEIIGRRPRQRTVIMCHGAFDLVHPGHVQHLMYAKGKAEILVASLTSDAYIGKADYRPFVPQELRAMNLAALEAVDYVIVDEQPTPIENLRFLQPDFFAKGYDYSENGINPRTQEEIETIKNYGGEILFTPGDVVYSSSSFIDSAPPNISREKLLALMGGEGISLEDLRAVVTSLGEIKVNLVGDTIIDSYVYCTLIGSGTSKTPTISVRHDRETNFIGGAAVVAKHLAKAGATVRFSTVLGDDPLAKFVLNDLAAAGIDTRACIDATRVTTQKNVFIAGDHRLLKVDKVDNRPISDRTLEELKLSMTGGDPDAFVFSDFRHGIFGRGTIPELIAALPSGPLRVADSQVASRWGNITDFQDFDLITPNEREARFALGDQDSVIRPLSLELYKRARCKTLILKLGDRGILTYRAPSHDAGSFFSIDSFAGKIVDPVGAGDALLAYSTLGLVATGSPVIASILGTMAAAIACEREGNQTVSTGDMIAKLDVVVNQAIYS
jgi:rfaE bifunctional protein kinase chain/domain/rfaE bifunctional protein nucleotidyltransferase chain/domain